MVANQDADTLRKEKVVLKLLRLTPEAQEGFVMTDYPNDVSSAELMEEYKGGLNAFVHLSLPDTVLLHIETIRHHCEDCGRNYYAHDVSSPEDNVYIKSFMPEDGHCDDCGSVNIVPVNEMQKFQDELGFYHERKDALLSLYNHLGNLVDFVPRKGYDSYDQLKVAIQNNIKH